MSPAHEDHSANEDHKAHENRNARRFIIANGLQNVGDQLVSAKTVLPWLLQSAGVPGVFTGLLVPIRESGSMLPQAALSPWVRGQRSRKRIWLIGAAVQAIAAGLIALSALVLSEWALGVAVVIFLAALAGGRALGSISSKDVQGQTISKGARGTVTGRATAWAGAATLIVGVALWWAGALSRPQLAGLLGIGAATWAIAGLAFAGIRVPERDGEDGEDGDENAHNHSPGQIDKNWWSDTWQLYARDKKFREFVNVRSLLLVSALSTAFIVSLSQQVATDALTGLAGFVLASGAASLLGGRVSGMLSDRSSKNVMAGGAAVAAALLLGIVAAATWLPAGVNQWVMSAGFFAVNVAHTAIRVARKTYVVDMAEGDERTRYVGAANSIIGVMLLIVGVVSSAIALAGPAAALLFLAAVGAVGVWRARRLPEVTAKP